MKVFTIKKAVQNSLSISPGNFRAALLAAVTASLVMYSAAFAAASVEIEIGFTGVSIRQIVETPITDDNGPEGRFWATHTEPVLLRSPFAAEPPEPPALKASDKKKLAHIMRRAVSKKKKSPPSRPSMNEVLEAGEGGSGTIFIDRVGRGSRIAIADGTVTIEPYLPTGGQVWYIIKLFDAGGREIQYSGKSLLWWFRPDGKQNFPLYFKGVVDPGSVYLHDTQGNYNATRNLRYTFTIKKGQRVEASTKGDPMKEAFMKIDSTTFGAAR